MSFPPPSSSAAAPSTSEPATPQPGSAPPARLLGTHSSEDAHGREASDATYSIVICTRNRRDVLTQCLNSIAREAEARAANSTAALEWDVWVIDNGSSDGTDQRVQEFQSDYPLALHLVREERTGHSVARNRALRESRADVLVYLDDDATIHPGWFEAYERAFEDPEVIGAGGPVLPILPEGLPTWFHRGLMEGDGGLTAKYHHGDAQLDYAPRNSEGGRGAAAHPRGCNMACRRELSLELGGFREDLGWGASRIPADETEFYQRLHQSGGRILYLPEAKIDHHLDAGRLEVRYLRRWYRGYGRASILMRPPTKPFGWFAKFAEQSLTLVGFSLRLALPGGQESFRAHKKQSVALGRLAQMLGL